MHTHMYMFILLECAVNASGGLFCMMIDGVCQIWTVRKVVWSGVR